MSGNSRQLCDQNSSVMTIHLAANMCKGLFLCQAAATHVHGGTFLGTHSFHSLSAYDLSVNNLFQTY